MDSLQINVNKIFSSISLFEKNNKKKQIIAISGPPGAGKSYLSNIILKKYNDNLIDKKKHAVIFPMDGYHLDNKELIRLDFLIGKALSLHSTLKNLQEIYIKFPKIKISKYLVLIGN